MGNVAYACRVELRREEWEQQKGILKPTISTIMREQKKTEKLKTTTELSDEKVTSRTALDAISEIRHAVIGASTDSGSDNEWSDEDDKAGGTRSSALAPAPAPRPTPAPAPVLAAQQKHEEKQEQERQADETVGTAAANTEEQKATVHVQLATANQNYVGPVKQPKAPGPPVPPAPPPAPAPAAATSALDLGAVSNVKLKKASALASEGSSFAVRFTSTFGMCDQLVTPAVLIRIHRSTARRARTARSGSTQSLLTGSQVNQRQLST